MPLTASVGGRLNVRIFQAMVSVTLAGLVVKAVATGKEFVVAGFFGRSDAMDAFLIAFLLPGLLINLFSESMNQALIPTLVKVRHQSGLAAAQLLLSRAMAWTCLLLVSGSLLMAAMAKWLFPLVLTNFSVAKIRLTEELFYGLLPLVLISGLTSNCTAVLNTSGRFILPALAPLATPMVLVVAVWLLTSRFGIWILVYANLVGAGLSAVLVIGMMELRGLRFRLDWFTDDLKIQASLREVGGQYGPVLLSGLLASGGLLVDQGMAATLPSGSVATLVYANRFVSVVLSVLAGAISTVLTPYLSELVAGQDWRSCRRTVNRYVAGTALVSVPIALAMIAASGWMVRVTYQRGAFSAMDTANVAPVQAMYAIQIPFFVVSRVFYRYLVARRRTSLILYCGMINLVLDVGLNLVCMRWLGVAGIALATSLWTVSTFAFLGYWAYRLLPPDSASFEEEVALDSRLA